MTKPDFSSLKPKQEEENAQQKTTSDNSTPQGRNDDKKEEKCIVHALSVGCDGCWRADSPRSLQNAIIGIDWTALLRAANLQAIFSIICIICLCSCMFLTGFSISRFTCSAWATYLLSCAYIGVRGAKWRSYAHVIAFCGMCTFQTLIYMSTMCWLAYSLYAIQGPHYGVMTGGATELLMFFTIGEVFSMTGTVFTGILGLVICCQGLGRLLHAQEILILDRRNALHPPVAACRTQV